MKKDKIEIFYNLMEQWFTIHEQGKTIPMILEKRNIYSVAIYGIGKIGIHVIKEIEGSNVTISYAIDKVRTGYYDFITVKNTNDELPKVDAILVTAIYDFEEIEEALSKKTTLPIISLEEIIYEG